MFHFDCVYYIFTFYFETDVFIDMTEKRQKIVFWIEKRKKINFCPESLQFWINDHGFLVVFSIYSIN